MRKEKGWSKTVRFVYRLVLMVVVALTAISGTMLCVCGSLNGFEDYREEDAYRTLFHEHVNYVAMDNLYEYILQGDYKEVENQGMLKLHYQVVSTDQEISMKCPGNESKLYQSELYGDELITIYGLSAGGEGDFNQELLEKLSKLKLVYLVSCPTDSVFFTLMEAAQANAWEMAWLTIAGVILFLILLGVYLVGAGGDSTGESYPLRWLDRLPIDVYTIAAVIWVCSFAVFAIACLGDLIYSMGFYIVDNSNAMNLFILYGLCIAALCVAGVLPTVWYLESLVIRSRRPGWVINSAWCTRSIRWCVRGMRSLFRKCTDNLSFLWKGLLILAGVSALEGIWIVGAMDMYSMEWLAFGFVVEKICLVILFIILSDQFKRLSEAGENLAAGNLDSQVDTQYLWWGLKRHGENLNRIGEGIQSAVEERMKSEHLKTELITNVSHDIKTPLTSIINYVDLLEKEPVASENAKEYLEVLDRQSNRLKKLIEDLLEASKASTGNVKVELQPCQAEVIFTQIAGEYEEKLQEKNLQMVVSVPQEEVTVIADGRHLWRVMDNLLNNVVKYAMPGTRVYLNLEQESEKVSFVIRNVSRDPLNVSSEELQERFVRGDSSRHTEGHGLGLSIAGSLTEVMGGEFRIEVDGDLFKAIVKLPAE